MKNYMYCYI